MAFDNKKRKVKEKQENFKNQQIQKNNQDTVENLKKRIQELGKEKVEFEKKLNQDFLNLIEKKTSEVSEILKKKEIEITQKYKAEFDQAKDYLYEKQFSNLVEILSHFEKVLDAPVSSPELKNYLQGFQMFFSQFDDLLSALNISKIQPKVGENFNSEVMVAIFTEDVKDKNLENKVLEVLSKGYKLNRRVIKLSAVKVGVFNES